MAAKELIVEALSRVKTQTNTKNAQIIHSNELIRADRELLLASGWLQEVMRGWYMLVQPGAAGDTAAWYANFWNFVRVYLEHRFASEYCLSAESSLDLHTENPITPQQVVIIVKKGAGLQSLMYDTSLLLYVDLKNFPPETELTHSIRVMNLPYALCKVSATYFQNSARDAEIALKSIKTPDQLSRIIIRYNLKTAAARIIGAYQFLQDHNMAESINSDLVLAGILVKPVNPFQHSAPLLVTSRLKSPYAGRIHAMWQEARATVAKHFPEPPGLSKKPADYLQQIEEIYQYDAYNSLSIEGYHVTDDLINRVKNQQWDPMSDKDDNNAKNALVAKGYFDAFQLVKQAVAQIINGGNAATIIQDNLSKWYQGLFGPAAKAGIIPVESLFGYHNERVFIRNSRHAPPAANAVNDAMEAFFECLDAETHPGVSAVLGHYFFVFIHPYMDGNGRIGRFLMNALLASGGYPWTVVRFANRSQYIDTLENTHNTFDMMEFTNFIKAEMQSVIE